MALVAIVGRPNVGKSTLFNRLSRERRALVGDHPGVTRDRLYAEVAWKGRRFTLVDTGGFISGEVERLQEETRRQVMAALEEADVLLFLADGRTGIHPEDHHLVNLLRCASKPVIIVVNKIDGPEQEVHAAEFYGLGVDGIHSVSAAHGHGIAELLDALIGVLPEVGDESEEAATSGEVRVSIVGRPNVGKSTLVNRILGQERAIVSEIPGTTRDAIDTPLERGGRRYLLIDTAGIRRKGRTTEKLEKLSVIKALRSIERAHVAVLLVDAEEGLTEQDLHIGGYIQERRRACVIVVNKWDRVDREGKRVRRFMDQLKDRFRFLSFAPILTISALNGKRVGRILPTVDEVFEQYNRRVGTGVVNRALQEAVERHEPPLIAGRRLKFYYATQPYTRPPTFVLFCNRPDKIHFSYQRYLTNHLRRAFSLDKTPIRLVFRGRDKGVAERRV